jgi:adenine-specific DNA-methyltransferase
MNKPQLAQIFSSGFNAESWQQVLREVFGVKTLKQIPSPIMLNDKDLAESAVELGSFETADERLIGLYQVNLNQNVRIEQNKVGVRELLRSIYKYDVDGALVVFVQGEKWRFSYISEIRVLNDDGTLETKVTEPKRFTYLFGVGENCRTAQQRFEKLNGKPIHLQDLTEAFSVEKLNKQFFKDYKDFFEKFSRHLAESKDYRKILLGDDTDLPKGFNDEKAKPIRDFAKILLGRLVFLQFLQKKGWMGVSADQADWQGGDVSFIQNLFQNFSDKNRFHSKALKTLFFKTLNKKRDNDLANELGENIKIPYLNGGLFDTDISAKHDFDFPQALFDDLLRFFENYNFTIDENDTLDREVGIDPEMLGHIFENLLEENREKGAFYTPKEIVKYMCQ